MIEFLLAVLAFIVAIPIGAIFVLLFRGYDSGLEEYYKEIVLKEVWKPGYIPKSASETPEEIIVDSQRAYSPIRVFLKKQIARLLGKEVPEVLIVFGLLTKAEQKAFLIHRAFSSSVATSLLDLDFIETLIYYFGHKYGSENMTLEEEVRAILRKKFESAAHRDCVPKLDSLEYSERIVLNPPPLKKPLLTNVLLPLVKEQERKLVNRQFEVAELETWKSFFMQVVAKLCTKRCSVLFIGKRNPAEYAEMLYTGLNTFGCVVVCARGKNIVQMSQTMHCCTMLDNTNPSGRQVFLNSERREVTGRWRFPDEESLVCNWVILKRSDT